MDKHSETLSNENGVLKQNASKRLFTFKPYDKNTKLAFSISFDNGKRFWNYRQSGLDLADKIDNFDGLEVYLNINGKQFGSILDMDETNLHKFANNSQNSKNLSVSGEEFDLFSVEKAEGKVFNYKPSQDSFKIADAKMIMPAGYSFSSSESLSLILEDSEFVADMQEAWKTSQSSASYRYVSENAVLTVFLKLKNGTWRAKVEKANFFSSINHNDGIEIRLVVGNCEGAVLIDADTSTFLKFDSETTKNKKNKKE